MMGRWIGVWMMAMLFGGACAAGDAADARHHVSIMTYNVKLLPRAATFLHHHPVKRARLIPAKLIAENTDVVVFQEAFDGRAIRLLTRGLHAAYPYMAGQDNRSVVSYKRAGGVLIYSKYPLHELESIRYSQCKGIDCYGHKGAILVEVDHPAGKLQVLGTHLQAGGGTDLKASQYIEAAALLDRHQVQGVPQFVAGDWNTHKDDTLLYNKLTASVRGIDGTVDDELKVIMDHTLNDMRPQKKGKPKKKRSIIDYVFVKANGATITSQRRYAREYQQPWSKKHKDLSDHFAVVLEVGM